MYRTGFSLALTAGLVFASAAFASTGAVSLQSGGTPAAVPQSGAAPASTTPAAGQQASETDDPIICKNQPIIGSRLNSRLCMPKHRWAQMHKDGQDFMRNLDERSSGGQEGP